MNQKEFPQIRIEDNGKRSIYDELRQRYVALTPEEEIRQNFIHFLITEKGYPKNLLANEVGIQLNGTSKRCDSVLYNIDLSPKMIIEYKAPHVPISQKVFDQILRYNIVLHVEYLIVTNGKQTYICKTNNNQKIKFLHSIPMFCGL